MEFKILIDRKYMCIPIKTGEKVVTLEIWNGENQIYEFKIPYESFNEKTYNYDYYTTIDIIEYEGRELTLKGEFSKIFYKSIMIMDSYQYANMTRPKLHFTANRGWINDPNGLVYKDGIYHLYFQYNPFNTEWENMCWGHSISEDLVHWKQLDTVLYPDQYGTIFSGCAINNDRELLALDKDAIIYFYTAAGDANKWSKGKEFTQRIAYSLDQGKTFQKTDLGVLDTIEKENRDPKVFWHKETSAYIMVLWLMKNEFGILRSTDLENWNLTQRIELEKAWECPDLFELYTDTMEKKWVFESADGYYFIGSFDGYKFTRESDMLMAYGTDIPYAAQSYSGVYQRVISVAWLRTKHKGKMYTGAMGIPRELSLVNTNIGLRMKLAIVKEFEYLRELVHSVSYKEENDIKTWFYNECGDPYEIEIEFDNQGSSCSILAGDSEITVEGNNIYYNGEHYLYNCFDTISKISVIFDKGIVEFTCDCGMLYLIFETQQYSLKGDINISGKGMSEVSIFQISE